MLNNDQREEAKKAYEEFVDSMPSDVPFVVLADFSTEGKTDIRTCQNGAVKKIFKLLGFELHSLTKIFVKDSGKDYKECLEYLAKKLKQKAYVEHRTEETVQELVKNGMDEQMAESLLRSISEGVEKALMDLAEDEDETSEDQAE